MATRYPLPRISLCAVIALGLCSCSSGQPTAEPSATPTVTVTATETVKATESPEAQSSQSPTAQGFLGRCHGSPIRSKAPPALRRSPLRSSTKESTSALPRMTFGFFPKVQRINDSTLKVTYTYNRGAGSNADASERAVSTYSWESGAGKVVHEGNFPPGYNY